jgi:NDP-sugar pyrophosphorylase family protein
MPKTKISITINEKTLQDIDSIIDNIYIRNRSQAIEHLAKNALGENKTAAILLGGNDGHLRISKEDYRPTARVKNSSVIELALKKLRENNFKTVFIVARHALLTKLFEMLKDGTHYGVKISYIEEKSSNGTADSLRLLKGRVKTNFLAVYGDIIFNKINIEELWNDHIKQNAAATIMLTTSSKPSEKGTVRVEGNKVLTFTQKPKKSDIYLVFSPIFVTEPQIFEYSGKSLEFDVFPELAEKGLLNGHLSSEKEIHIHSKNDLKKFS